MARVPLTSRPGGSEMAPLCLLPRPRETRHVAFFICARPRPCCAALGVAVPGHGHPAGPGAPRPSPGGLVRPSGSGRGVRATLGPPPVPSGLSPCPASRSCRGSSGQGQALAGPPSHRMPGSIGRQHPHPDGHDDHSPPLWKTCGQIRTSVRNVPAEKE